MRTRTTVGNIGGPPPAVNERLLSVKEAAALLGVSERWVRQSAIPRVKFSRRTLFRPSDVAEYVSAHVTHRVGGGL